MRLNKFYICWTLFLFATFNAGSIDGIAQACKAPTAEKQAELSAYVVKRNHFDPAGQLTLVESAPSNGTCFWMLHYRESSPKAEVTFYLSPDGKYLFPSMYDLSVDPLAEEKAKADMLMKTLVAGGPPSHGAANAPITIVEFSDFECPFCQRMTNVLEKELTAEDRKDVRIVFRNYPLPMHPWAKDAAEVAGCAALQSDTAFWKMNAYLFENQKTFTADNIRDNATAFALASTGVDKPQFQMCLDKKMAIGGVTQDTDLGNKNGVHATPTLFINGTKYEGMKDAAALRAILASIRKSQQADGSAASPKVAAAR